MAYIKGVSHNVAEANPQWKGDKVGLKSLHEYIKLRLPRPSVCADCGEPKPLDLANISQEYKRDLTDWEWLCRKCHMTKDGRLRRLIESRIGQVVPRCSSCRRFMGKTGCKRCGVTV